jgi:hypothetical protein
MIYKIHVHFYFEHDSAIFKSNSPPPGFFIVCPGFSLFSDVLPLSDVAPPQRCGSPVLGHGAFSSALTIKLGVGGRAEALMGRLGSSNIKKCFPLLV